MMQVEIPRILFSAPASGCGKTTVCCAVLQAFTDRGLRLSSFKCGPDYIDPMFHRTVIETPSYQMDSFFAEKPDLLSLFYRHTVSSDLAVLEGAMGYYDGIAGISEKASAYEIAGLTRTPVVLVVDCARMSGSVAALVRGFLEYREDSAVVGVILNRISPARFSQMKELVESQLPVKVLGYFPPMPDCTVESRHLGLVTAGEIQSLKEKMKRLGEQAERSVDLDGLLAAAKNAAPLEIPPCVPKTALGNPVIAVAMDRAFCFYYEDNLELLQELGATILPFSPLEDSFIPDSADGLLLGGGYPELYAKKLSQNEPMLASVRNALRSRMPCIAECGGFLYLHQMIEGADGFFYPMAGLIPGKAKKSGRNRRFGYLELTAAEDQLLCRTGQKIRGHEFHYWDSEECGDGFLAKKPYSGEEWSAAFVSDHFYAGYPHLYFYSNPQAAENFCRAAAAYREEKRR